MAEYKIPSLTTDIFIFDDDFNFVGSQGNAYQMIGNAVPPKLAKALAFAVVDLLKKYKSDKYV